MSQEEQRAGEEEKIEELARPIRRAGLLFFLFLGLVLVIPMVFGTIDGVRNEKIWDPLTGARVTLHEPAMDCVEEAGALIYVAGEVGRRDLRWEQLYRRWVSKCRQSHPELLVVVNKARERMMRSESLLGDLEELEELEEEP